MPAAGQAHATSAIEFAIALVAARSRTEKNLHEKIRARYGAEETQAALARLRELGVERAIFALPSADTDAVLRLLDRGAALVAGVA